MVFWISTANGWPAGAPRPGSPAKARTVRLNGEAIVKPHAYLKEPQPTPQNEWPRELWSIISRGFSPLQLHLALLAIYVSFIIIGLNSGSAVNDVGVETVMLWHLKPPVI